MTNLRRHPTNAEDRIPFGQLVAYGMGGFVFIALFNSVGLLMGLLGNISLGLSAFWLGFVLILPRLWDAVSDPVMGHVTDNTRSRWGRRRPYILIGGIAVALSFVGMWWVPRGEWARSFFASEASFNWFQLAFVLGSLLLFFTACTVFEIPHGALGLEMSSDYHERTRLFSAKSFLGNLFAMGTPWLIKLAGLKMICGPGGDEIDGMRFVSMLVAVVLIPMSIWWFIALREPNATLVAAKEKSAFWHDMRTATSNKAFLMLVGVIFTLAMGFNFVSLFNFYITIFYLYGGDVAAAADLLGFNGTAWAVTALVAVFPLNWLSRTVGKNKTLLVAIGLMCSAQLAKIVCYNPQAPYLTLIPTVLLSSGMLMFFTLASSMVGDVCDADELETGTRKEGSYYSVFWWFIKMGTAFASFVTGVLLVLTDFDEKQNVAVNALQGDVAVLVAKAEGWRNEVEGSESRADLVNATMQTIVAKVADLKSHLQTREGADREPLPHTKDLIDSLTKVESSIGGIMAGQVSLVTNPSLLINEANQIREQINRLKTQAPWTLFRLRLIEIGVPLVLSIVSILLTLRYPLTEERCYEIKAALQERRSPGFQPGK